MTARATLLAVAAFALPLAAAAQDCVPSGRPMSEAQWRRACHDCGGRVVGSRGSMRCEFDTPAQPPPPTEEARRAAERTRELETLDKDARAAEARGDWSAAAGLLRRALTRNPDNADFQKRLTTAEARAREQAERAARERVGSLYESVTSPRATGSAVPFAGPPPAASGVPFAATPSASAHLAPLASAPSQSPAGAIVEFADVEPGRAYTRRETLRHLRRELDALGVALRRLGAARAGDAAERREWEGTIDTAMTSAWKRGRSMLIDGGLWFIDAGIAQRLESANAELRKAVDLLSGETDPARRERLHAAVRLLEQQRETMRAAQTEAKDVLPKLAQAKQALETSDWAESNPGDVEKSLRGVYTLLKTTLKSQAVQDALAHGKDIYAGARYAQVLVDTGYDLVAEGVAWHRIKELNRASEQFYWDVGRLQHRMEDTVRKIQELERSAS